VRKDSTQYTFIFALIICVVCSLLLSLVSEGLRSKKELNEALDIKKNILKAVALREPVDAKASTDVLVSVYKQKIQEIVIDAQGNLVADKAPGAIAEGEALYPVYIYKEGSEVISYAFPIVGKGLWSTLYGYFALEADAKTVRGITFYKHGETPGLGAEIEANWFTDNYKGKSIWDVKTKDLKPVAVVKGKVNDVVKAEDQKHYVDGISGATMTAKGVTEMVDREIRKYEPYFSKIRK